MTRWPIVVCLWGSLAGAADRYPNFTALSAEQKEGRDYRIVVEDRDSPVTILAIHGGEIDVGTDEIARAIAGGDFNLYLFLGIKPKGNADLHITSERFDEPRGVALAAKSKRCLSIHGSKDPGRNRICIGGGDAPGRTRVKEKLEAAGLPLETALLCPGLEGTKSENIVNRCGSGVQMEFSSDLRKELRKDGPFLRRLAETVRAALKSGYE